MTILPRATLAALLFCCPTTILAQQGEPWWLHLSPLAGGVVASVPGGAPRAAAALHLEISRSLPVGLGIAAGYLGGSGGNDDREVFGPWAEAAFAYRFKLRFRGHLAPFAGPVLGTVWHDHGAEDPAQSTGPEDRWLARWFFGGRAGIDIPVGSGWPAVRAAITYRNIAGRGGLGGADITTVMLGFRWSRGFVPPAGN